MLSSVLRLYCAYIRAMTDSVQAVSRKSSVNSLDILGPLTMLAYDQLWVAKFAVYELTSRVQK